MVIKEHGEERAEMRGKGRAERDLVHYTAKNVGTGLFFGVIKFKLLCGGLGKYFITTTYLLQKRALTTKITTNA